MTPGRTTAAPTPPSDRRRALVTAFGVIALSGLLVPQPAHAYLDPISGSVLLQVVVAGVLAFSLGAKRRLARLTAFFRKRSSRPNR